MTVASGWANAEDGDKAHVISVGSDFFEVISFDEVDKDEFVFV